jgi:predicted nuclease with TOPRIM domain
MMISYILCICFISLTVFGEELHEHHNLQLILKEMESMKKMLQHNSEKLIEIDYLRERTLVLENEIERLKHQNQNLNQKVETLERQCAEHSVEVIILAYFLFIKIKIPSKTLICSLLKINKIYIYILISKLEKQ